MLSALSPLHFFAFNSLQVILILIPALEGRVSLITQPAEKTTTITALRLKRLLKQANAGGITSLPLDAIVQRVVRIVVAIT